jgi:acetyltransferase
VKRDVTSMLRPRAIGVLGASASRRTQGNGVIQNLQKAGYSGRIFPIHPTAETIDGLSVVPSIELLPRETELVVVAVPAPGVMDTLTNLDRAGIGSAMVFTNGFAPEAESAFRRFAETSRLAVHGPNCMGVINISDQIILYPSTISDRVRRGKVALIAQSGSAAISLINSSSVGFSKIVTVGSEFQVAAPDYMRWFAEDDETRVIGVVLESIREPRAFAEAVGEIHDAGKSVIVLKVGRSELGAKAVKAHTGALISPIDAYDCFFEDIGVPSVEDYDQLAASLECFAVCRASAKGLRLGLVGISGGETALACDIAAEVGVPIASFSEATTARIRAAQPGATGQNPLDLGATVHHTVEQDREAVDAILDDPGVDILAAIQDAQGTLTPTMLGNYTPRIRAYGEHGRASTKPVLLLSPSSENTHPQITADLEPCGVPVLRGLRNGLVAMRSLGKHGRWMAARGAKEQSPAGAVPAADRLSRLREEVAACSGPLPWPLAAKLLAAYGIPLVRSGFAKTVEEASQRAKEIGYPIVLKISSPDIPHRSEAGGVALGIADDDGLRAAIGRMLASVKVYRPEAGVDGLELQEQLSDWVEAMAGFSQAHPFAPLTIVGMGGTLVELQADRAVSLSPFSSAKAEAMIEATRLGKLLGGYRNLVPKTGIAELAALVSNLSRLAADFSGQISECDINPVLVHPGSGEVRVVDALLIAGRSGREPDSAKHASAGSA